MKILLCGEGAHEMGEARVWDRVTDTLESIEGWMQILGRRLINRQVEFEVRLRRELFLDARVERKLGPRPPGHGRKAKLARFIAGNEEFDAVVFMVDADSNEKREWKATVHEIEAGFAALESGPPGVACVPMSASESWLLADPVAWTAAGLGNLRLLPKRPESIWGQRNDPQGDHPHQVMARACAEAGALDNLETRCTLATTSNLATVRSRCPLSYASFHDAMMVL